jgi:anthranilate 1,2-dioxygenase small subunit
VTDTGLAADNAHVPPAVTALIADYAHCIDSDRIEDWPSFFTDPCLYRITTRDNDERNLPASIMLCDSRGMLMDRVVSVRMANVYEPHRYRHMISCIRMVETGTDFWRLDSNYLVTRTMLDGTMAVFSTGVYRDRIVMDGGAPRFNERVVVCDHGMINNLIAIPI